MTKLAIFAALLTAPTHIATYYKECDRRCHRQARIAREWGRYERHPMPWCTWGPESGVAYGQWSMRRYRAYNTSSSAGGKFQILNTTWYRNGGPSYGYNYYRPAQHASPRMQERIARRVLRSGGLSQWVGC